MSEITRILGELSDKPERSTLDALLPLVYDELRALAKSKLAGERQGHTLQPTDLVHEAFMRLVPRTPQADSSLDPPARSYPSRSYFFAAAAEAMRRILVEAARKKMAQKRGAGAQREWYDLLQLPEADRFQELLHVHESLDELAAVDPQSAEVVKLRYYAGLTMDEIAEILGVSKRQAQSIWAFARTWLYRHLA